MAKGSEKKTAANAAAVRQLYTQLMIAINVVYITYTFVWNYTNLTSFWSILKYLVMSVISYVTYNNILTSAVLGTPYSSWQDVLFINWGVQILSMFTSYAYLIYFTIPAYVMYHYGGYVWGPIKSYFSSPVDGGEEQLSKAEMKRKAKKERQAAQPQVKYR